MDSPPSQQPWGRSPTSPSFSFSSNSIQSLSSILNNPLSSTTISPPEFALISTTKSTSDISRSDFLPYLSAVADPLHRFHHIRNHATNEIIADLQPAAGEALVACLREVPSLYFKEDFRLEDGSTFRAACPFSAISENAALQEKLSQYLDVVELHLVKEISLRSSSFFEAQGQLQDLNAKIVEGCARIRELKDTVRLIDSDLVESARQIQQLNATRTNLLALLQKLRLILYVNQALSALKLLVASADCAGALDVTDDLQQLLDGDELTGLHCFRHLRDHVIGFIESINSILSAEFIRASLHDATETDVIILSKAKARASLPMNGKDDEVKLEEEETTNFKDRLLPTVIGLLRTAKLPSVLRFYRDTLTADMKSAIKTAVAELLPVLAARGSESEFFSGDRAADADGGGASLASKLRSLSSDCFVHLLSAIFMIVQAHLVRAAEVKKAIEWILSNRDGHYAADSVAAAIAHGAVAAEISQESEIHGTTLLPYSPQRSVAKGPFQGKTIDAVSSSNMSKNFRADVLRENAEAVFAACDAAHGRWAKLLGVRAVLHPRLKLQEFLTIYNITQEFITATEKIGGRLGYSIRGTLQSQAKAFVDFQHESRMAKIKALLDQETWVEIDVPEEFQSIINILFSSDVLTSGNLNGTEEDNAHSYSDNNADAVHSNAEHQVEQTNSIETSRKSAGSDGSKPLVDSVEPNRGNNRISSAQNNNVEKDHKKSVSQALLYKGVGYHMVNCGLILLKMLSEYIDMNNVLPTLSSEVVHRVAEILKFFNTRTCQLVLGAGAMQVSGLKSITSKHLALASQVISFIHAIIPEIRQILFLKVPETRKSLLLSEIDRVAQDYKVHRDEIHSKLVQIMRERLLVHLRGLPQIVESWNRPEEADPQPSQFARSLTKEVGYLQRVLSRTLNDEDVHAIFRQVVIIFHSQISEAFSRFDISTSQAQNRLSRDIKHILQCIRSLPSGDLGKSDTPNWGQLDEFLVQRFGSDAVQ
ncbi:vacuolar protein sorting-associated protein 54, chloroplastic [Lotus japonicus]|uniref:vacuolar protein sorting-associated protein 54, chloroplastic n=1 Tax=Lotus japonicus TaxID=34305 RepID=UPI0025904BC2|nr:vacuolar protein sorting-associated protein 54, chloroplastic [Lotus japonicus]